VEAKDPAGNSSSSSSRLVNVKKDMTPPVVQLYVPKLIEGTVKVIRVYGNDNVAIDKLVLDIDDVLSAETFTSPLTYPFLCPSYEPDGNNFHTFRAIVYDKRGNAAQKEITAVVLKDLSPSVFIITPQMHDSLFKGVENTIRAEVKDDVGVDDGWILISNAMNTGWYNGAFSGNFFSYSPPVTGDIEFYAGGINGLLSIGTDTFSFSPFKVEKRNGISWLLLNVNLYPHHSTSPFSYASVNVEYEYEVKGINEVSEEFLNSLVGNQMNFASSGFPLSISFPYHVDGIEISSIKAHISLDTFEFFVNMRFHKNI
jgi:hypothetical protein